MAWSGQLVAYFMFDLNRLKWNVRTLVSFAEQFMIDVLKKYNIEDMQSLMHRRLCGWQKDWFIRLQNSPWT